MRALESYDPEIASLVRAEERRQRERLVMIASENYASEAVLAAQGSVFTNKYAEGLPGRRYYGGCEYLDEVEALAIERAKSLFGADHANVQPHAGSQANMAVYLALLEVGDTIMGLDLSCGGHLTHGAAASFSGKLFKAVSYGVDMATEQIDYEALLALAKEHRPRLIIAGASAYPRQLDFARFRQIADEVGAYLMADTAHIAGLIAAGVHPTPVPFAEVVTSTTHKTLRGPRGGFILCKKEYARSIDQAVFPGMQGGPLGHVIAAKAVCFKEAAEPGFVDYQRQVVANARTIAEELSNRGYRLVTGGTDTHLVLIDVGRRGLTGKQAEQALGRVGLVLNKNVIPYDPLPPTVTSGIRIGTPALTTRGMGEAEMRIIAAVIDRVLSDGRSDGHDWARRQVRELCNSFPVYATSWADLRAGVS